MSTYFYCRVSTAGQDLARQIGAARAYAEIPEENVYCDKASGKNFEREAYIRLINTVVPGDEVIVKELDRLGRNKEKIKTEIQWFKEHGITLRILDVPTTLIDFQGQEWLRDMVNNILIEVLGAVAEQEREKTLRRQREGIEAMPVIDGRRYSQKKGKYYGRQRKVVATSDFETYFRKQQAGEMTVAQCCEALGCSRSYWYQKKEKK